MKSPTLKILVALAAVLLGVHVYCVCGSDYPHRTWYIPFAGGLFAASPSTIQWAEDDVSDCSGHEDCMTKFAAAMAAALKSDGSPEGAYLAYMHRKRAEHLLSSSDASREELQRFQDASEPIYRTIETAGREAMQVAQMADKRALYGRASDCVRLLRERFPDERHRYGRWALEKETTMRAAGTWDERRGECPPKREATLP